MENQNSKMGTIITTVIITAILVGGGIFLLQQNTIKELREEIKNSQEKNNETDNKMIQNQEINKKTDSQNISISRQTNEENKNVKATQKCEKQENGNSCANDILECTVGNYIFEDNRTLSIIKNINGECLVKLSAPESSIISNRSDNIVSMDCSVPMSNDFESLIVTILETSYRGLDYEVISSYCTGKIAQIVEENHNQSEDIQKMIDTYKSNANN